MSDIIIAFAIFLPGAKDNDGRNVRLERTKTERMRGWILEKSRTEADEIVKHEVKELECISA